MALVKSSEIQTIVILTGAGVSAESGLATFRGPDSLWEGHRVEDVATPEAFRRDPELVHQFYDPRRAHLGAVPPKAGCAPTSFGSARCRMRWSGSTRRCRIATCSYRSGRRARSIRPPASSRPR